MEVNNSAKIGTMISFDKDDFYFLQILKRRKDNPEMEKDMVVIKNYYIESMDQYIKLIPRIILLCKYENARAYFRLNKRNYKKIGLQMIRRVADHISSGNNKAIKTAFDSVCGEFHSDTDKKWIVDIDFKDLDDREFFSRENSISNIISTLTDLQLETEKEPMIEILPTKNGVHIITRPFNLKKFRETFFGIDVHKDNPSILYCP
jgi:hypothetical protein